MQRRIHTCMFLRKQRVFRRPLDDDGDAALMIKTNRIIAAWTSPKTTHDATRRAITRAAAGEWTCRPHYAITRLAQKLMPQPRDGGIGAIRSCRRD